MQIIPHCFFISWIHCIGILIISAGKTCKKKYCMNLEVATQSILLAGGDRIYFLTSCTVFTQLTGFFNAQMNVDCVIQSHSHKLYAPYTRTPSILEKKVVWTVTRSPKHDFDFFILIKIFITMLQLYSYESIFQEKSIHMIFIF